jgi:hypothetical protein
MKEKKVMNDSSRQLRVVLDVLRWNVSTADIAMKYNMQPVEIGLLKKKAMTKLYECFHS